MKTKGKSMTKSKTTAFPCPPVPSLAMTLLVKVADVSTTHHGFL
jgi:hypothetical protein